MHHKNYTMNSLFIKKIEDNIKCLESTKNNIAGHINQPGYETITETIKISHLETLNELIEHNKMRLVNAERKPVGIAELMMYGVFDNGILVPGHDGNESVFNLPTTPLMSFENQLHVAINIIDEYNLIQCDNPFTPDLKTQLHDHLVLAHCPSENNFTIFEHYKLFAQPLASVMSSMHYVYNIEPHSQTEYDGKIRRGFLIKCA